MNPTTNLILPANTRPSRSLSPLLAWVLVAPLACTGGQGDSSSSASSTSPSGSSPTSGVTAGSGKSTSAGTDSSAGTGTDSSEDTQTTLGTDAQGTDAQGTDTQGTDTQGTDTQGTDTDTDTSCAFFTCNEDIPEEEEYCDYVYELCPEGSKCSLDGDFYESACFDLVPMPDMLGEPCEPSDQWPGGMDSCDYDLLCWEESCVPFCHIGEDDFSCPSGYHCIGCQDCALWICIPSCDPLLQDCTEGDVCIPDGDSFICALDASGDEGTYGDPCEYANACDPGLYCLSSKYVPECKGAGCCTPFCDLADPSCPDEALECIPWFEEGSAPPGNEDIGFCGIPQP